MKPVVSSHSIQCTTAGVVDAHICEPGEGDGDGGSSRVRGTIVTVHPWSALGGGEHNTIGLARNIVNHNINKSEVRRKEIVCGDTTCSWRWRVVTFTLKSNSFGGPIWGIFSNHTYEVQQTVDVVHWIRQKYGVEESIVLLGSSAGAPMAGTAVARLLTTDNFAVSAYIAVGYTFGNLAALGFGRHFASILSSSVMSIPKLFIMGERDEFTSVAQLEGMTHKMRSQNSEDDGNVDIKIVPNVGHFELESPRYNSLVSKLVLDWLDKCL